MPLPLQRRCHGRHFGLPRRVPIGGIAAGASQPSSWNVDPRNPRDRNPIQFLAGRSPVVPLPDFEDAFKTQQVLEAAIVSAQEKRSVKVAEMK